MKKLATILLLSFAAVSPSAFGQQKVMARFVPERLDDFIFENEYVAGRFYGKALESCGDGQVTSPGIDVWVKTPGALVANQRYIDELQHGRSYHINWGNGKDCYKVSRSLGAGASSPIVDGVACLPTTNFRSFMVNEESADKVVFTLNYPEWSLPNGVKVSLSKKVTVYAGTYFCKSEDVYSFSGAQTIEVAAGIFRHAPGTIEEEYNAEGVCAIWEHASDQSVEKEDGMIGVAVIVPGAGKPVITKDKKHSILPLTVKSGETYTYYFGSCWSVGCIDTAAKWFNFVQKAK